MKIVALNCAAVNLVTYDKWTAKAIKCVQVSNFKVTTFTNVVTYSWSPTYFIDIDECDSYDCGNGTCINIPGSYICICPSGYIFNFDDLQCTGI